MNDSRNLSGPVLMPGATAAAMKYAKSAGWTGMLSKQAVIPWYGYKCPICRSKYRKGAKP